MFANVLTIKALWGDCKSVLCLLLVAKRPNKSMNVGFKATTNIHVHGKHASIYLLICFFVLYVIHVRMENSLKKAKTFKLEGKTLLWLWNTSLSFDEEKYHAIIQIKYNTNTIVRPAISLNWRKQMKTYLNKCLLKLLFRRLGAQVTLVGHFLLVVVILLLNEPSVTQLFLLSADKLSHGPLCVRWQACEWEWWGESPAPRRGRMEEELLCMSDLQELSARDGLLPVNCWMPVEWPKMTRFRNTDVTGGRGEGVLSFWAELWIPLKPSREKIFVVSNKGHLITS